MAISVLEQHQELVKQRSRGAWLEYVGRSRTRELTAYAVALASILIAIVAVSLARATYSSIIVQHDVRTVDRFGQTIGQSGAVYRLPPALEAHAFISTFLVDVFSVYSSGIALQRNYNEAQSFIDSRSDVGGILKSFWSETSPLKTDQTWDASREQERMVNITSILDRGPWGNGAEEYEVEWSIAPVLGDGHLGDPTLYKGDVALVGGAQRNDANPWGILVTHFSWSALR